MSTFSQTSNMHTPTSDQDASPLGDFDWAEICTPAADLLQYNTMHLGCQAQRLITLKQESEVEPAVAKATKLDLPIFVLSGGSNVILPKTLNASVLHPTYKGINILNEDENSICIEVMGGENWHQLVVNSVNKGWYGLENLALIPGLVGASPVQNIGAYGVQLDEVMTHLKAFHIPTQTWHQFDKADCQFGYRDSKFKREAGQWLITRVGFKLHKDPSKVNANYGDVATLALSLAEAEQRSSVTAIDVMNAIIEIRQTKLPDPKQLPNCGSFFKNPIINNQQFAQLKVNFPNIVGYPMDEGHTKVAAGWMIDKAGLKGKGILPIKTHRDQALVLVNHSPLNSDQPATQEDILATQQFIQQKIEQTFGVLLEREPVWVDQQASYNS